MTTGRLYLNESLPLYASWQERAAGDGDESKLQAHSLPSRRTSPGRPAVRLDISAAAPTAGQAKQKNRDGACSRFASIGVRDQCVHLQKPSKSKQQIVEVKAAAKQGGTTRKSWSERFRTASRQQMSIGSAQLSENRRVRSAASSHDPSPLVVSESNRDRCRRSGARASAQTTAGVHTQVKRRASAEEQCQRSQQEKESTQSACARPPASLDSAKPGEGVEQAVMLLPAAPTEGDRVFLSPRDLLVSLHVRCRLRIRRARIARPALLPGLRHKLFTSSLHAVGSTFRARASKEKCFRLAASPAPIVAVQPAGL